MNNGFWLHVPCTLSACYHSALSLNTQSLISTSTTFFFPSAKKKINWSDSVLQPQYNYFTWTWYKYHFHLYQAIADSECVTWCWTRSSDLCCTGVYIMSADPADVNNLKFLTLCVISDWLDILLDRFHSSLFVLHLFLSRCVCPWPSNAVLVAFEPGMWTV